MCSSDVFAAPLLINRSPSVYEFPGFSIEICLIYSTKKVQVPELELVQLFGRIRYVLYLLRLLRRIYSESKAYAVAEQLTKIAWEIVVNYGNMSTL